MRVTTSTGWPVPAIRPRISDRGQVKWGPVALPQLEPLWKPDGSDAVDRLPPDCPSLLISDEQL